MKPTLPQVCTRYDLRNPVYHLPNVTVCHTTAHTFAEQSLSLRYCLIKHLNTEGGYADLVHSTCF